MNLWGVEKLHDQNCMRWWDGPEQRFIVKQLCIRGCVLVVSWTNKVSLTKVGNQGKTTEIFWRKVVFHTNLEQMFKPTATTLNSQPTMMQQRLGCALKNARLLPQWSSSESTVDVWIKALMWPNRKKFIGVRSGNLGDQATGPPCPIQQLL